MKSAVVLIAHGTVDDLDDLPEFLRTIRRGHPAPPALVAEVRRRYEAIGGKSPLLEICRDVAHKLEGELHVPVRLSMRLWKPYPKDVLAALLDEGVEHVAVVPLAQHSAHVYAESVEAAAKELVSEGRPALRVDSAKNWGQEPALTAAFAAEIRRALAEIPGRPDETQILMTAHSLPLAAVRGGDPYETEVRASVEAVARAIAPSPPVALAFQSQGMGGGEWLGPDLPASFAAAKEAGRKHVLIAPIGFLADHVEVLYDLDIEARALLDGLGITFARTRSLNASEGIVRALANVAAPLLARA